MKRQYSIRKGGKIPGVWKWTYQVIEDAFFWNKETNLGGPGEG